MCEYCQIIKKEKSAEILYEDDVVLVFVKSKRHIITIPKEHVSSLEELKDETLAYMFIITNRVSSLLFEATKSQGTNMFINNGKSANQEINHIAIDTIFRVENDDLNFKWTPKKIDQEKLISYQEKFINNINKKIVIEPKVDNKKENKDKPLDEPKESQDDKSSKESPKSEDKKPIEDYRIKQLIRIP